MGRGGEGERTFCEFDRMSGDERVDGRSGGGEEL